MDKKQSSEREPLILNDVGKCPPSNDTWATTKAILHYSIWPIVGMIFHPMYTVVNAAVAGRIGSTELAGLGLGSLTIGILLISIGSCFCMVVGSFIGPAYGDNKPDLAKRYTYRQFYLNTVVYLVTLIPVIWIDEIYAAIG